MQARRALLCSAFAASALAAPAASWATARLVVTPTDSLIDAPVSIRASGLPAGKRVTLTARTADALGKAWQGRATFRADEAGRVDPARERALAGTYTGRDAMGLFWSMLPVAWHGRTDGLGFGPPPSAAVRVSAIIGKHTLVRATIVRRAWAQDVSVRELTLERDGLVGSYCSTPSMTSRPAIVEIGGSEGGRTGFWSCRLLASHGYPTLALAYFGLPGLPQELSSIPLEYFQHGLQWLGRQPGVDPGKLVMMGVSRGGEGALLAASTYPNLVHAAVGYVPSAFVFSSVLDPGQPAWTLDGQPVPYLNGATVAGEPTAIKVERIAGPTFVVGAVLDALWPSANYVLQIADRLRAHGRADVTALTYYSAGHGVGLALPYLRAPTVGESRGRRISLGGTPAADAKARDDSWPKLLAFLSRL